MSDYSFSVDWRFPRQDYSFPVDWKILFPPIGKYCFPRQEYSFPVDWWGVGALIFEMGSGKAPFGTDNTFAIQQRILSTSVQWPGKDCPVRKHRGLASLVTQFLTHLPDKRLGCDKKLGRSLLS